MTSPAREAMLARIRRQLSAHDATPPADIPSDYRAITFNYHQAGKRTHSETLDLFIDRLIDYEATVIRTPPAGVARAVSQLLSNAGHKRVLVPAAYPAEWLPPEIEILRDENPGASALTHLQLDVIHAVLTTCKAAIASTGTLLLQHTPQQGRRALTLLADHHVCVVHASQVVETVPEGLALVAPTGPTNSTHSADQTEQADPAHPYPITTISGPSATADIEMTRIRGVHGPRHLGVVIVDGI